jgi:hypothetical protein
MARRFALAAAILLAAACSRDDPAAEPVVYEWDPVVADTTILFMGNSHSSVNELQAMVAAMVQASQPDRTVATKEAPGWMFLDQRLYDAASLSLLHSQDWSFVVLQAQKYSTSRTRNYSTDEASELVRQARAQRAIPILFPEWPLQGVDETMYIYRIHVSIAEVTPACVAPIGQAWDVALGRHPEIGLYADDGNHSSYPGAFLTALILATTMTGFPPASLPDLAVPLDPDTQAKLRAVASDTVRDWPPGALCPDD